MSIERRLSKLEGKVSAEIDCPACDPRPETVTITYRADDPDPRIPPSGQETPELQECSECGRRSRVFG